MNITVKEFKKMFADQGKGDRFSEEALETMYDFMQGVEMELQEEWEANVDDLCSEFTEYRGIEEYNTEVEDIYPSFAEVNEGRIIYVDYLADWVLIWG